MKFKAMLKNCGSPLVERMKLNATELHPYEQQYKDALAAVKTTVDSEKTSTRAVQKQAVGFKSRKAKKFDIKGDID